ncbi:MAG: MurR/RpiR family transcriptional regulator [Solirubrobacteraceae bacterium]
MADSELSELFAGHRLTPVQRRIAAHIVSGGTAAAFSSSVELAEQAGVSQPSVTRLATALGYSGFPEFQRAIQTLILQQRTPASQQLNKMQTAVQRSIDQLSSLRDSLSDSTDVEHAAALLAGAPVLAVYGSRSAAPLAAQFGFFASRIHPDVRLLGAGRTEATDQLVAAAQRGGGAMIAVVLPRYPVEAGGIIETARSLDMKVVLVIDSPLSELSGLADVTLDAPANTELVFDSALAPSQLLSVLLEALADVFPERSRQRLEMWERLALEQGYFRDQ